MRFIKHIAGQYNQGVQRCILCGEIIIDDRGVMYPTGESPPKAWDEGEVFMSDGSPRITMKADPSDEYPVKNCQ